MKTFKLLCNGNPIGEYQGCEDGAIFFFSAIRSVLEGLGNTTEIVEVKPEPVPFTIEDAHLFRDRWVRHKDSRGTYYHVWYYNTKSVYFNCGYFTYQNALKYLEFDDGTPFGK